MFNVYLFIFIFFEKRKKIAGKSGRGGRKKDVEYFDELNIFL